MTYEDVRALYIPVLRHRILLNFHAESDRLKQDDILKRLLEWKAGARETRSLKILTRRRGGAEI